MNSYKILDKYDINTQNSGQTKLEGLRRSLNTIKDGQVRLSVMKMRNGGFNEGLKRGISFMSSANTSMIEDESSGMPSVRSKRNISEAKKNNQEQERGEYEECLTRRSYVGDLETLKQKHQEVVAEAVAKEKLQQEARPGLQRG